MQISQLTRSGGLAEITKTELQGQNITTGGRASNLSDFSCPERLMFVLKASDLTCYRPAADLLTPFASLTVSDVSQGMASISVTSSQGGLLQLDGSADLTDWQSVTNVQTVPGVTKLAVPTSDHNRYFYKGTSQ